MTVSKKTWVEQIMGLPVSVLARGEDLDGADEAVKELFEELRWVDAVFSPYKDDSEVTRISEGTLLLEDAHPLVQEVAVRAARARDETGGLFDAMTPDGRWDPSGYVKGWAVERASRLLLADLDWCVNAGGDIVARCPSGEPFRVGVEDPLKRKKIAVVVPVTDAAVATSGTAARGNHLYDPRSGKPATALASLTVVGPSLEWADVLATAAFVAGSLELVVAEGYEGMSIAPDGSRVTTAGFPLA